MKTELPLIEVDPEIMSGAPVIRGTRVPVEALFGNLADGLSLDDSSIVFRPCAAKTRWRFSLRRERRRPLRLLEVLFDECVPRGLRGLLPGHVIKTTPEMGWRQVRNSALLARAELAFDAFLTSDKNLGYQQNLVERRIAIVVLPTNIWRLIRSNASTVAAALDRVQPGEFRVLSF